MATVPAKKLHPAHMSRFRHACVVFNSESDDVSVDVIQSSETKTNIRWLYKTCALAIHVPHVKWRRRRRKNDILFSLLLFCTCKQHYMYALLLSPISERKEKKERHPQSHVLALLSCLFCIFFCNLSFLPSVFRLSFSRGFFQLSFCIFAFCFIFTFAIFIFHCSTKVSHHPRLEVLGISVGLWSG